MERRYPLAALCAALGLSEAATALEVGLSGTTLKRAREWGLTADAAERYAVRAGFTPGGVWPQFLDDEFAELSVVCADEKCDERFIPVRKGHRFHSPTCRTRHNMRLWQREKYQNDPEFAEADRARARAYYEECKPYVRARQNRLRQERKRSA